MRDLLIRLLHKAAGVLAASGLLANVATVMLGLAVGAVTVTPAWASSNGSITQCTTTTSMGSATLTYTAAMLGQSESVTTGSGNVTCTIVSATTAGFPNECMTATFSNVVNTTNASYTIPIQSVVWNETSHYFGALVTGYSNPITLTSGVNSVSMNTSGYGNSVLYGTPVPASINQQTLKFSLANTATSSSTPPGTYTASIPFAILIGPPASYGASGACTYMAAVPGNEAHDTVTLNVVIPATCSISTTTAVAFGSVSQATVTAGSAVATGAVATNCNSSSPYTIYLGDGNNRQAVGSGLRQMAQGTSRLPYQLYKDSAHTQVWDATGGTSATGGSGGVTISGTGTTTLVNTPIYGLIPTSTTVGANGAYSDSVAVTLTY